MGSCVSQDLCGGSRTFRGPSEKEKNPKRERGLLVTEPRQDQVAAKASRQKLIAQCISGLLNAGWSLSALMGVNALLLPSGSQASDPGHQPWQQASSFLDIAGSELTM